MRRVSHSAKVYAHKGAGWLERGGTAVAGSIGWAVVRSGCLTMTLCCGGSVAASWKAVRRDLGPRVAEESGRRRPRPHPHSRTATPAPVMSRANRYDPVAGPSCLIVHQGEQSTEPGMDFMRINSPPLPVALGRVVDGHRCGPVSRDSVREESGRNSRTE